MAKVSIDFTEEMRLDARSDRPGAGGDEERVAL